MSANDIDERATRAAAQLRDTVAARPLRDAPTSPRSPWKPRLAVAAAFAVVAVAIIALAAPGRSGRDPLAVAPDGTPYWTFDPPSSWRITGYFGTQATPDPSQLPLVAVLATPRAPLGPLAVVSRARLAGFSGPEAAGPGVTGYVESTLDGRRFVTAAMAPDRRMAWIEVGGNWVSIWSRGLDDASIAALARGITVGDDGAPAVNAPPAGLAVVGKGTLDMVAPALQGLTDAAGTVTMSASSPDGAEDISLAVAPFTEAEAAYAGLSLSGVELVEVRGRPGWSGVLDDTPHVVVWHEGDRTFALTSFTRSTAQLVALAATVRPARRSDVDAVTPAAGDDLSSPTTVAELAPTTTSSFVGTRPTPAPTGAVEPVTVDVAVSTPNELVLSGAVEPGLGFSIDVTVVGDGVRILPVGADAALGFSTHDLPGAGATVVTAVAGSATLYGGFAISRDPSAAVLVVTRTDGRRYSTPLVMVPGRPDVRVATLMLPEPELAGARVLAADGHELEVLAMPGR